MNIILSFAINKLNVLKLWILSNKYFIIFILILFVYDFNLGKNYKNEIKKLSVVISEKKSEINNKNNIIEHGIKEVQKLSNNIRDLDTINKNNILEIQNLKNVNANLSDTCNNLNQENNVLMLKIKELEKESDVE